MKTYKQYILEKKKRKKKGKRGKKNRRMLMLPYPYWGSGWYPYETGSAGETGGDGGGGDGGGVA